MTTLLQESAVLPPLAIWQLGQASWLTQGSALLSYAPPYGGLLVSPVFELPGGYLHEIRLGLEVHTGGITFGAQDPAGRRWLQLGQALGRGWRQCRLTFRLVKAQRFRLALANGSANAAQPTHVTKLNLSLTSRPLAEDVPEERWKREIREQWDTDPCGDDRGAGHARGSLAYFQAVERDRYARESPWMPTAIDFARYRGKKVLEIGGGLGTDLAQFAQAGALVTDCDLSRTHLELARRNLEVRGLNGTFVLADAEELPFADASFDVVYAFGVIHHTPATEQVIRHVHRVLKPGGEAILMVYARHSWNFWYNTVYRLWWKQGLRRTMSLADILSANTEHSPSGGRPLVKVYTARQCRALFTAFRGVRIRKYQLKPTELPIWMLRLAPIEFWGRVMGWNLLIQAIK